MYHNCNGSPVDRCGIFLDFCVHNNYVMSTLMKTHLDTNKYTLRVNSCRKSVPPIGKDPLVYPHPL